MTWLCVNRGRLGKGIPWDVVMAVGVQKHMHGSAELEWLTTFSKVLVDITAI